MKFCKNLKRVVELSNPEWTPFWTDYKMLKKVIKGHLSSYVTHDSNSPHHLSQPDNKVQSRSASSASTSTAVSTEDSHTISCVGQHHQQPGDEPSGIESVQRHFHSTIASPQADAPKQADSPSLEKNPGEIVFFKLLHAELRKANSFFERAQEEFRIREERVRDGVAIMKKQRPSSDPQRDKPKWSLLAKSIFWLQKELMLFETFAIMTFCSFSKILKKHDKVTGHNTRDAFMRNVVSKASFTNYPQVMAMISRCNSMYGEVSNQLTTLAQEPHAEGKSMVKELCEDEKLFVSMIFQLNAQAKNNVQAEGIPHKEQQKHQSLPFACVDNQYTQQPKQAQKTAAGIASIELITKCSDAENSMLSSSQKQHQQQTASSFSTKTAVTSLNVLVDSGSPPDENNVRSLDRKRPAEPSVSSAGQGQKPKIRKKYCH